jgi:heterotetrameric sarcosine oxidase gamma subunit
MEDVPVPDLSEKSPCAGMLPATAGAMRLEEVNPGPIWALAPNGDPKKAGSALKAAHGLEWPQPNGRSATPEAEVVFFDRQHAVLIGADPAPDLLKSVRATEHSDAWCVVSLSGAGATDALARLSTLDLQTMPEGATARSHIGHMMGHITRLGAEDWRLMVFRSMASTLAREVKEAMHHVHARHG